MNKGVIERSKKDIKKTVKVKDDKGKMYETYSNNDGVGCEDGLIDWSAKKGKEESGNEVEKHKIIDEFGRTVWVDVGSREWVDYCSWRGRQAMVEELNYDGGGGEGYTGRSKPRYGDEYYGTDTHSNTITGGGGVYQGRGWEKEEEERVMREVREETEKGRLEVRARRIAEAAAGVGGKGMLEGVRVHAPVVELPEEERAGLAENDRGKKRVKNREERMKELLEMKKRKKK